MTCRRLPKPWPGIRAAQRNDLVTPPDDMLSRIDEAIARLEKALRTVRQIPRQGQDVVKVDGIEHELTAIAERLQSLRDDIAGDGDPAG